MSVVPGDVSLPQYAPTPRELDDVELLRMGVLDPLHGFQPAGGAVTLEVPDDVVAWAEDRGGLELTDAEGVPLGVVGIEQTYPTTTSGLTGVAGDVRPLPGVISRAFGDHYEPPSGPRTRLGPETVTVAVDRPLSRSDLDEISARAGGAPVLFVVLAGTGTPRGLSPHGLIRITLLAARGVGDAEVVAAPAASRADAGHDRSFRERVVRAYAPGEIVLWPNGDGPLDDEIAEAVASDRPGGVEQGVVVFFTGLSGSGKSTVAQALRDRLLENGGRTVSLLDGDRVRRNLSRGLTFSQEDRETNIERIGWVAAEVARHGGVAICSPIAPFDVTRKTARAMAEEAGAAFVLVHVATPLAECERRDRKGLYAKARRGEIEHFTGISSPYEVPTDADLTVDTTGRTIDDVLDEVLALLVDRGFLAADIRARVVA